MMKPRSHVHIVRSFWSDRIVIKLFASEDSGAILWAYEQRIELTNTDKAPLTCARSHPVTFFYDMTLADLTRNSLKSLWIHNLP